MLLFSFATENFLELKIFSRKLLITFKFKLFLIECTKYSITFNSFKN